MPKNILLTGCTKGCGFALACEYARDGHIIMGCGRDRVALDKISQILGPAHHICCVNIADDSQVEAWASTVVEKFGPPDLLINNAAVIHQPAPLWRISRSEFDGVIDVNIKGTANVLRHFLPYMLAVKRGIIVNFSSGWGRSASAEVSAYCASKWAIEALTQSLSQELPRGMAVVALNPGIIDTDMLRVCFGSRASHYWPPATWAKKAAPFILSLSEKNNGQSLDVPDAARD